MPDEYATTPDGGASGARSRAALSPSARIVLGAVAVGVLLVVVGIGALVVFGMNTAADTVSGLSNPPATQPNPAAAASGTAEPAEPSGPAPEVPDSAVFTFRDIFQPPAVKVAATETASGEETSAPSGDNTSTAEPSLDPDTLFLQDIASVNDKPKAVLALGGKTYTLGKGQRIPETPWKVLEIGSSSVVMLYGDAQIRLSIGQGMQQK